MGTTFRQASMLSAALCLSCSVHVALAAGEVNVYSNRPPELVQPLLDAFTKKTGIAANLLYLDSRLIERILSEGEYSPADVILATDDSRLAEFKAAGITQALKDAALDNEVPARYRDPQGHWFALTLRPRVFYASAERVKVASITYEELARSEWKAKLCLRDGRHASNIGLIAAMLAAHGAAETEKWLAGLKANLARKPKGNDRNQAEAVAKGECDLAIGNSEYIAALAQDPAQQAEAAKIRVIFPNAAGRGVSVGISGMALARQAPNRDNAVSLMRFLSSRPAQELYSNETNEYPVLPAAEPSPMLKSFGRLKAEDLPIAEVIKLRAQALQLVDKVEFNEGPGN